VISVKRTLHNGIA